MTVLICEDEEIMLTALAFRIRRQGFEVITAEDGREAVERIKEHQPDIIVSDIMMPHLSGLELLEMVRVEMKSDVPVLIISALEREETILEAFRKGASDFIAKPFKPNELILRIKKIIQEKNLV